MSLTELPSRPPSRSDFFKLSELQICQICAYHACFAPSCTAKLLFLWKKLTSVAPPRGIWLKIHYWGIGRKEKSPAPGGNQTHNLKSFGLEACALPLCYNHCPRVFKLSAIICNIGSDNSWKLTCCKNWESLRSTGVRSFDSWIDADANEACDRKVWITNKQTNKQTLTSQSRDIEKSSFSLNILVCFVTNDDWSLFSNVEGPRQFSCPINIGLCRILSEVSRLRLFSWDSVFVRFDFVLQWLEWPSDLYEKFVCH